MGKKTVECPACRGKGIDRGETCKACGGLGQLTVPG